MHSFFKDMVYKLNMPKIVHLSYFASLCFSSSGGVAVALVVLVVIIVGIVVIILIQLACKNISWLMRFTTAASRVNGYHRQQQQQLQSNGVADNEAIVKNTAEDDNEAADVSRGLWFCSQ